MTSNDKQYNHNHNHNHKKYEKEESAGDCMFSMICLYGYVLGRSKFVGNDLF